MAFAVEPTSRTGASCHSQASQPSFVIDKTSGPDVAPCVAGSRSERRIRSVKDLTKDLKCFKQLENKSKVQGAKARSGPREPRARAARTPVQVPLTLGTKLSSRGKAGAQVDVWKEEKEGEEEQLERQQRDLCGKHRGRVPASLHKKPNLVAPVPLPHPGLSYHPRKEDFASLVHQMSQEEAEREKTEQRVHNSVSKFYQHKSSSRIEAEYMEEMSQGLMPSEESEDGGSDGESRRAKTGKATTAVKRKTKAQRNRQQRVKQRTLEAQARKQEAKKSKQPLALKKLLRQIDERQEELERRRKERQERAKKQLLQPNKRVRSLLPEEVIANPSDMKGNLRTVKVAGNLLEERFKSVVARSLVEVRKKKRKSGQSLSERKAYVKRSHADPE